MLYYAKKNDELYHHGILGQKWGVRRYQNPDGTLTPAGKKRLKYAKKASDIAYKNADRLRNESNKIQESNQKLHDNYSGKDAWKEYAKDVYGTTDSKEYGLSDKAFKKWMSDELRFNLNNDDAYSKAQIERYDKAAKKWYDMGEKFNTLSPNDITKDQIKAAKFFYLTQKYGEVSLDQLVSEMNQF